MTVTLLQEATSVARELLHATNLIESVCLFGSVARGDSVPDSDIDFLLVGKPGLTPSQLTTLLPTEMRTLNLSFAYYTRQSLLQFAGSNPLFLVHLKVEGRILFDRENFLENLLQRCSIDRASIDHALARELNAIASYDDLRGFNDNFLFLFEHIYVIAKNIAILALAREGILEFEKERALKTFAQRHPIASAEVDYLSSLRPFYALATERRVEPLPFPSTGTTSEAARAVRSVRRLADVVVP